VLVQCTQEQAGVRFLVEAPHEDTIRARRQVDPEQLVQEAGGHGRLARAAEADKGDDAVAVRLPQPAQLGQFRLPAHEMRRGRQAVNGRRLGGMWIGHWCAAKLHAVRLPWVAGAESSKPRAATPRIAA
jgi:hypothetical protein